jgi:hypothetical protein
MVPSIAGVNLILSRGKFPVAIRLSGGLRILKSKSADARGFNVGGWRIQGRRRRHALPSSMPLCRAANVRRRSSSPHCQPSRLAQLTLQRFSSPQNSAGRVIASL